MTAASDGRGVLVFRRHLNAQDPIPYSRYLAEIRDRIVLFTVDPQPEDRAFLHVEEFESFERTGLIELRALELHRSRPFGHVFAQSEHDILRAARIREWLRLPGQSYDSARAFRDKLYMRTLASAGGVPCPRFAALDSPIDLHRFTQQNGFPCVVKPVADAGSRGIRVLRDEADLKGFLRKPLGRDLMVEDYVEGPTFHVDALFTGRALVFASVSQYFNSCLAFQSGGSLGSYVLHPEGELTKRLRRATEEVVEALPAAPHLTVHAEFFLDPDDRIVFCEIACRPGGSRTADVIELVHGVRLYEQWVRRSLGLPVELPEPRRWSCAGRFLIPPREGRLLSMPRTVPFDWVADYRPNAIPGQLCSVPTYCTAHIASFLVTGTDEVGVQARMQTLDRWFRDHLEWEGHALTAKGGEA